jgi:hypothetical protein
LFRRLLQAAGHTEELADRVWQMLTDRGFVLPPRPARPAPPVKAPKAGRAARFKDPSWTARARPGIGSLRIVADHKGAARVGLDGAPAVTMAPALARLLRVLAAAPRDAEGFPAFQSYERIAAQLSPPVGRPMSVHAVVNRISRLRGWLVDKAPSPLVVETAESLGARLRVRVFLDDQGAG